MLAVLYSECRGSVKDGCIGSESTEWFFVWFFGGSSSREMLLWFMLQAVLWMWRNAGIILSMHDLLQF